MAEPITRSPFPGMDPYLEAHWRDVHARFIVHAAELLQPVLPPDLRARVEERVFVDAPEAEGRSVYPDVRVVERRVARPGGEAARSVGAAAEPLVIHLPDEPITETCLEIREVGSGGKVITVIEVLSLANKTPGEGQRLYRKKQSELRDGGVSLVEIDLTRAGQRVLSIPPQSIPPSHRTPYQVCVRRGSRPTAIEVYRAPLRERLPVIAVPLRVDDRDAPLDLQAIVDRCYAGGGYDDIDYRVDPVPPLDPAEAEWADALLRANGRR